jgi:hypothetical protein
MNFLDESRGCGVINSSSLQLIKAFPGGRRDVEPLESWGMNKGRFVIQGDELA